MCYVSSTTPPNISEFSKIICVEHVYLHNIYQYNHLNMYRYKHTSPIGSLRVLIQNALGPQIHEK